MKKVTKTQLKKVQTIEDLENLGIGRVYADISHRGGGLGFYASAVAEHFNVSTDDLPSKFGAGCNYLGGGMRGAIFKSSFNTTNITGRKAELLEALAEACVRVYENIENEAGMNDEEGEDGETNWDAAATKAARDNGTTSAY
jgi:hypothetical protein